MDMKRALALFLLVGFCGCGSSQPRDIALEAAIRAASFDSSCQWLLLTERMGDERFKFQGCGRTFIYDCEKQLEYDGGSIVHWAGSKCQPVTVIGAPAAPVAPARPPAPPISPIKAVIDSVIKTARASCPSGEGNDGFVDLQLRIEPSGRVGEVQIASATASETTAKCVVGIAQAATFPAHNKPEPVPVAFPVIIGDPSKVPDLLKEEVDAVMTKVTATARASCPTGEGNDGMVTQQITIEKSGRVRETRIASSTASDAAAKCVAGITQMTKFPPLRWSAEMVLSYKVRVMAEPEPEAVEAAPIPEPTPAPAPKTPKKKH